MATIEIKVSEKRWRRAWPDLEKESKQAVEHTLHTVLGETSSDTEISLLFASDAMARTLNRERRGQDTATNVLSFPVIDWHPENDGTANKMKIAPGQPQLLGDIVFAFETIIREAEEQQKPLPCHASHLLVHGALHLLGYEHNTDSKAQLMERLEIRILSELGIANPYEVEDRRELQP